MISKLLFIINELTKTKRRIYFIGLFITFLITLKEVVMLSYNNFQIFSYGSLDFWAGINPYSGWNHLSLLEKPLDIFLYGPLFSILFTPFALLPGWLGVFCWNTFTYSLFYLSVFTLPDQFSFVSKKFIFFFSALLLYSTLSSVQFNPIVASLFLFSFTLFEKKQGFWAVLLILLSGFTKVYGIFQLPMILFYTKFWKNVLYAILIGIVLLFLPVINVPANELAEYYHSWIRTVMDHSEALRFYSIYRPICVFFNSAEPYMGLISAGVFLVILSFALVKLKLFKEMFLQRAKFLGIIMSWAILFGVSSERHTYVIATVGYAIWYLCSESTKSDRVLLWMNFVLLGIVPKQLLSLLGISNMILVKLNLFIIVYTITWFIMVYKSFLSDIKILQGSNTARHI